MDVMHVLQNVKMNVESIYKRFFDPKIILNFRQFICFIKLKHNFLSVLPTAKSIFVLVNLNVCCSMTIASKIAIIRLTKHAKRLVNVMVCFLKKYSCTIFRLWNIKINRSGLNQDLQILVGISAEMAFELLITIFFCIRIKLKKK